MAKEHLDFDLEFLDSNTEASKTGKQYHKETFPSRRNQSVSDRPKYSLNRLSQWWAAKTRRKKIELIVGYIASLIILGSILIALTSDDTSSVSSGSTPPTTTPVSGTIPPGDAPIEQTYKFTDESGRVYYCSTANHAKATSLKPSDYEKSSLESDQSSLDRDEKELDDLEYEIDSMYVNENSSQFMINRYNNLIDEFNTKSAAYKRKFANLDSKIDAYNQKVETYNNFLRNNCSPS